jgi:hypothetical protein
VVVLPVAVKVDRQSMATLLVEEQTCLLLILVVLLQGAKGDCLAQLQAGSKVVLDGTKSYDPNGDSLSCLWLQLAGGQPVSLSNNNTSTPSFVAPSVTNNNMMLTFELVVSDGQANSAIAFTYVTVQP